MFITSVDDDLYCRLASSWHQYCAITEHMSTLKAFTACLITHGMSVIAQDHPDLSGDRHNYPRLAPYGTGTTIAVSVTNLSSAEELSRRFRPGINRKGRIAKVSKHTVLKWALDLGLKAFAASVAKKD